jgi:hypothetical protein
VRGGSPERPGDLNKTPEIVGSWIIKPDNSVLLAVDDDSILAVGSVTDAGEITLNYVSPDARFRGNRWDSCLKLAMDIPTSGSGPSRGNDLD